MRNNDIIKVGESTFRVLSIADGGVLCINCEVKQMPKFMSLEFFDEAKSSQLNSEFTEMENLSPKEREVALKRYSMIAGAVTVLDKVKERTLMIARAVENHKISKQTLRGYLWLYLVHQDIAVLAPKKNKARELNIDQKNMRWALNKFFYTKHQNSLPTSYTMMLKEKYCDSYGVLLPKYPTYNQFRYFYRKTRKLENYYISRGGIKAYQRSKRPLVGDGVQQYTPNVGTAMLDGTICDIYLIDETGQLVGRPILILACDTHTSMCIGYALLWEGGVYSLQALLLNILEDKKALCERLGIAISKEQWDVAELPGTMITDGGLEFKGQTFGQITELGVSLITLPGFRPELKGPIEKLFDLVQGSYKDVLKGKGVLMPDFQERGSRDYRKDAVLTMNDFEKIVVRCLVYHNCNRVLANYPYTKEMLEEKVSPYAQTIWNYKKKESGATLIQVSKKDLILTLLPRTTGRYTRYGLKVNKLRYYADGYKEQFLQGGEVAIAYNPDNAGKVWLKEKDGRFVEFALIESRFDEMSVDEVKSAKKEQRRMVRDELYENHQAKIELLNFIEAAATKPKKEKQVQIKGIKARRISERKKARIDMGGVINE